MRRAPRLHWVSILLGLVVLMGVVSFHAYTAIRPEPVRHAGEHRQLPENTLALAFHGGPDPKWTPRVLDVLKETGIRATFFVTGTQVTRNPEVTRRIAEEGHRIGIDGFRAEGDHVTGLNRALAQAALADVLGAHTPLVGAPAEVDSGDRDHQDIGTLVRMSLRERGGVVRLHDDGSIGADIARELTRQPGYRFVAVTDEPLVTASGTERFTGAVTAWSQRNGGVVLVLFGTAIAIAALLGLLRTAMQLGLAHTDRRLRRESEADPPPWFAPPVSVVVPAYNEALNIAATVRSIAANDHLADVEVVVVDDGSTDGTADRAEELGLPGVTVLRQDNQGKPAALNAGISRARHDVLVLLDGDTIFEPDTIGQLVQPFADSAVGAVSGNAKVGNRKGLLGRWQHLEYCAGSNLDRQILHALRCIPTVPGAVGAFRRAAITDAGGVSDQTLAEDTDLTMAVTRAGWRVAYRPQAKAWTEAPSSLRGLFRQRYRWSYGTFQSMWKHRRALVESGPMGRFGLLYLLAFHLLLPLLAPVMDLYVLYGFLVADAPLAFVVWTAFLLLQTASAGYALRLDGESLKPLWAYPLQQLVYRQLTYAVVIQSVITAAHGTQLRWMKVRRTGLLGSAPGCGVPGSPAVVLEE
ncbi:Glycosyltransferase, catalytic subunit of cellulose synthase and poly-beta-1,6-N-acetylglucosamine synthase [Lentzea fradiae]|uniref:Glycosyltransferase, catalytic subunit of cellulose synthase and poly-beta-1,6-N-acetylglucosamine synthase n=1 Tax=Lentzea fradiae TaxID=200378 RepID=A0A1G8BUG8_9PSEU|nr:bifunctional polysaccharide deacetylase/glycosyltransferase family 2 protein [Lentzea fradiae]SDH36743.1 Glycosyltransferase, catalytic subunit of cellulose synthase and poly-beta-1,6-N-acetylglucosamine synthase [Lentzea fradiae]